MNEIDTMAKRMCKLFNKTSDDLAALMLIAQAEGKHPATAAQEYDIIQGRPALKSQSALARFQMAGGKVQWITRTEEVAEATFFHAQGGEVTVKWDMTKAGKMGLTGKDNWKKQPGVMLQWRCIAEGVRICYPACLNMMYLVEEVQDFEPPRQVSPAPKTEPRPEPSASRPAGFQGKAEDAQVISDATKAITTEAEYTKQLGEILETATEGNYLTTEKVL